MIGGGDKNISIEVQGMAHEVDGFCSISDEDNLLFICIQKPGDLAPRLVIEIRGFLRQEMHAPVNVCTRFRVESSDGFDHLPWLETRCRAIQIDKGPSVDHPPGESESQLVSPRCQSVTDLDHGRQRLFELPAQYSESYSWLDPLFNRVSRSGGFGINQEMRTGLPCSRLR